MSTHQDTFFQKISPRHVGDSPRDCGFPSFTPSSMVSLGLLDVVSYIVLGSSATLALFLFLTTWYYRRSEAFITSLFTNGLIDSPVQMNNAKCKNFKKEKLIRYKSK